MMRDFAALVASSEPQIIGVLNVTPDSFSDGGRYLDPRSAVEHARRMAAEGAALVEIGGESTAPGSRPLSPAEELARIEEVARELGNGDLGFAVDTYHAATAARCLELGAIAVNDTSALRADPDLARVVAAFDAGLVLMHAKDAPLPHVTDRPKAYGDLVEDLADFLLRRAERAVAAGVDPGRIVLDPGWGRFLSLDPGVSFELLRRLGELVERLRPFPVMVAVSRKGFLGGSGEERDALSQLVALHAVEEGARFIRSHRVGMMRRFLEAAARLGRLPAASVA